MHGGKPSGEHIATTRHGRVWKTERGAVRVGHLTTHDKVVLAFGAICELRDVEDATSSARSG
jgi:hypothetical protein